MNNTTMKRSTLVGVQTVTSQFAACHPTNSVDEIAMVQILESVLIGIVSVGTTVEVMS